MDYMQRAPEDKIPMYYIIKDRSRAIILNLGYDFIEFKRKFKKDLNQLKYRLPSINLYS